MELGCDWLKSSGVESDWPHRIPAAARLRNDLFLLRIVMHDSEFSGVDSDSRLLLLESVEPAPQLHLSLIKTAPEPLQIFCEK